MEKKEKEEKKKELIQKIANIKAVMGRKELDQETQTLLDGLIAALETLFDKISDSDDMTAVESLITNRIEELITGKLSTVEEDSKKVNEELEKMKKSLETTLLEIKKSKEQFEKAKPILKKQIEENLDQIVKSCKEKRHFVLELKRSNTDAVTTTGSITPQPNYFIPAIQQISGINPQVHPVTTILDFITIESTDSAGIVMVNQEPTEGDAAWTPEGQLKPQASVAYSTQLEEAKTLAVWIKVSEKMLKYVDFIVSEIEKEITRLHLNKLSMDVFGSDGSNDTIKGIMSRASVYVQTCLNGKIENPGMYESIVAVATQIRSLGHKGKIVAFVNECDASIQKMRKDQTGQLLQYEELIKDIIVVPDPAVDSGEFLIGDFSVYKLYENDTVKLTWYMSDDDFKRNMITIRCESDYIAAMSNNNRGAIVKGDFASIIASIAKA